MALTEKQHITLSIWSGLELQLFQCDAVISSKAHFTVLSGLVRRHYLCKWKMDNAKQNNNGNNAAHLNPSPVWFGRIWCFFDQILSDGAECCFSAASALKVVQMGTACFAFWWIGCTNLENYASLQKQLQEKGKKGLLIAASNTWKRLSVLL